MADISKSEFDLHVSVPDPSSYSGAIPCRPNPTVAGNTRRVFRGRTASTKERTSGQVQTWNGFVADAIGAGGGSIGR